jgi:hypothetical protein
MDKPPSRFLSDRGGRGKRYAIPQQPSEIVKERDTRLAIQAEKTAALRRAREARHSHLVKSSATGVFMPKRELLDTGTDKRYVRRNKRGTSFVESDDVGRSLAADRRKHAKTTVKAGYGDKGDQVRPKSKPKTRRRAAGKAARRKGAARKSASKTPAKRRR